MVLIDVHCHLTDEELIGRVDEVLRRAKEAQIMAVVTSTLNGAEVPKALNLIRRYVGYVYLTIGCEPTVFKMDEVESIKEFVWSLRNEIVGIGEVGLDYFLTKDANLRLKQVELFREWIKLAKEVDLPLVVHSRSAGKYAITIILESGYNRVLMHAFDGKPSYAKRGVKEGLLFSIPTSVWGSRQKQKLASALPLENIVLETDSPVLPPIKGIVNEPANLIYAAKKVSELKGLSLEEVAEVTTKNARNFYGI